MSTLTVFRGGGPGHSIDWDPAVPQMQPMGAWWVHLVPCSSPNSEGGVTLIPLLVFGDRL